MIAPVLLLVLCLSGVAAAEEAPQQPPQLQAAVPPLTLRAAVTRALDNYPAVRAALANMQVSAAGVDLARTSFLPRADVLWQVNRATRNSVTGLILPQPVVAGVSGGIGVNRNETAWSSATGILLNWEAFDFGARRANVLAAESTLQRATAGADLTRLQVATAAADGFLGVVAADQTVRAATAAVERARVFHDVVVARVNAGLRPAVDAERARAELAIAENQQIIAEQNARIARVVLAQYTGQDPDAISIASGPLLEVPPADALATLVPAGPTAPAAVQQHPLVTEQNAAIEESRARVRAVERSYVPRVNVLFNTYARGSGVLPDGRIDGGLAGLAPDITNWAVGVNVFFPLFDRPAFSSRVQAERQRQVVETARYDRVIDDLEAQLGRSNALLDGARRIAENTPYQLAAARATHQQATARYQAGLSSIVEVADAQRLLTQAEIDDALARLNVWRGLLLVTTAQGNLEPFLQRAQP
jgi:outer membrane protein TolC